MPLIQAQTDGSFLLTKESNGGKIHRGWFLIVVAVTFSSQTLLSHGQGNSNLTFHSIDSTITTGGVDMNKDLCGKCEYRQKIPFSTYHECTKFGGLLKGDPSEKLEKCKAPKKGGKYVEVK